MSFKENLRRIFADRNKALLAQEEVDRRSEATLASEKARRLSLVEQHLTFARQNFRPILQDIIDSLGTDKDVELSVEATGKGDRAVCASLIWDKIEGERSSSFRGVAITLDLNTSIYVEFGSIAYTLDDVNRRKNIIGNIAEPNWRKKVEDRMIRGLHNDECFSEIDNDLAGSGW